MLSRFIPGVLVRFFARPYVAGGSVDEALQCAAQVWNQRGLHSTLDLLGEDVKKEEQVRANLLTYRTVIRSSAEDTRVQGVQSSVSVKPSAFTVGGLEDSRSALEALAAFARDHCVPLTIDMEDRKWTDFTLDVSTSLFRRGFDVGTVLQTRLNRTEADLESIPEGMRVRLVIGIYPEPKEVAVTDKTIMKERMLQYARRLLERGAQVEFATHDEAYLERFAKDVAPVAPERCEIQMLLGVPRDDTQHRLLSGAWGPALPVRLYVPFAVTWEDATAYLRRRMDESPSMILLVLRNLFRRGNPRAIPPSLSARPEDSVMQ
ncbi:MAG: proline dehydrogenase family protein [Myxococcota bacterium]